MLEPGALPGKRPGGLRPEAPLAEEPVERRTDLIGRARDVEVRRRGIRIVRRSADDASDDARAFGDRDREPLGDVADMEIGRLVLGDDPPRELVHATRVRSGPRFRPP